MTTYIITFEIKDEGRLAQVKQYLRDNKSAVAPIHHYAWAIRDEKKPSEIVDELKTMTKTEDRLFVIRSGTSAAWLNTYAKENSEWLKKHL